ncbi:MAG: tetratricopeptide repeat protein [Bacteroidetes bacterium]|nr:tetratricopeptide repeat protein [Bacteroidota bacterium]
MRFKNFLIIIFLIPVFCRPFFAQERKLDSLIKKLSNHKEDTMATKLCYSICNIYNNRGMIDSAAPYIYKGYAISKKLKYVRGIAIASNYLGQLYNHRGVLDSAVFYFTQSMTCYEQLKDSSRMSGMLNNLGVVYKGHGNISKAMDYYFKALKIKEQLRDTGGIASAYTNIGHLFSEAGDTANTIKYHRLALALRKEIKDIEGVSNSYMAIGLYYQNIEQLDLALKYLQDGLKMAQELGDEESTAIGFFNIANVYYKQKKLEKAKALYEQALVLAKKGNNYEGIANCLAILGDMRLEKKEYLQAIELYNEAYEKATVIDNKELINGVAHKLSLAYEATGDFKKAYAFQKIWILFKDSVFNQENTRKLTSETLKYEHEKEKLLIQKEQERKEAIAKAEVFKKDLILFASILFLVVVSVFSFIIFKRLRENKKQKDIIEQQRNEMIDSINYAKRIQFALLAHTDLLQNNLPQHFVFFKPKDIVSGDFYWATKKDDHFYLAVCDSTGHGVPGAFMSLLNISFLNEAINEKSILAPNQVLNHVRKRLLENMDGGRDGMDAAIMKISLKEPNKIEYAAANNAPILIRNGVVIELSKDKMPVGKGETNDDFVLHKTELQKGDSFYLYTDGFADQFGGPKGKKFKYKQLNQLLLDNCNAPMAKQKEVLDRTIEKWRGNLEQVDDVCVIGIKI